MRRGAQLHGLFAKLLNQLLKDLQYNAILLTICPSGSLFLP
jgi:hypothetical protein